MSNTVDRTSRRSVRTAALTHIELVMVLGALGLGGTVVLPSLSENAKSRAEARCLNNLRQIAAASWAYAAEDPRDQLVPLHQCMVRTFSSTGFSYPSYAFSVAEMHAFGGQTPTVPFPGACDTAMMRPADGGNGYWVTETRPLDKYVDASGGVGIGTDPHVMEVFHCPADTGQTDDPNFSVGYPPQARRIPLYDMLGSSYCCTAAGLLWLGSGGQGAASFTTSPWGHRASSLQGPLSEIVLYTDAMFWSIIGNELDFTGWHGRRNSDIMAYCDGSARMTYAYPFTEFTQEELEEMGYTHTFPGSYFLKRGPTWQTDCYPTPGAMIKRFNDAGQTAAPQIFYDGWPFDNFQYNLPPE